MSASTTLNSASVRPDYRRPRIGWIKRRARRYLRAFDLSRRDAVELADFDFDAFVRPLAEACEAAAHAEGTS